MIVSCNDSAITEIEVKDVNVQIPGKEPPEIVTKYHTLMEEIRRGILDGTLDNTKVLKANRLAVELGKYDGIMAFIFQLEEAESQGKPEEELQEIIEERYGFITLAQASHPCSDHCHEDLATRVGDAY